MLNHLHIIARTFALTEPFSPNFANVAVPPMFFATPLFGRDLRIG
jgi:hypothetical protein